MRSRAVLVLTIVTVSLLLAGPVRSAEVGGGAAGLADRLRGSETSDRHNSPKIPHLPPAPPATPDGPHYCGWRNDGSGRFESVTGAVTEWGPEKSIRWKTPLPHRSNASPILVAGRFYVCAEPDELICVAADTGRILWRQATSYLDLPTNQQLEPATRAMLEQARVAQMKRFKSDGLDLGHHPNFIGDGKELPELLRRPAVHVDAGYTTPTPVSDGQNVFALFATGLVTSFDAAGTRRWTVLPEKPVIRWGQAASPLLAGGRLMVHLEQCYALDPATGAVVWRTPARRRWATPVALRAGAEELIVLGGGEVLRATDGAVVADLFLHKDRCDCYVNYWGMSSPVAAGAAVYFVDATPNTVQRFDWKPGSAGRIEFVRRWQVPVPSGKYFASPVLHDGRLYLVASTLRHQGEKDFDAVLNKRVEGTLIALSAESGEVIFVHEIGKDTGTYHTLTFADGKLWLTGHNGTTVVVEAGPAYRELGRNRLEATRSHAESVRTIAVFGERAVTAQMIGHGSQFVRSPYYVTPLDGLRAVLEPNRQIRDHSSLRDGSAGPHRQGMIAVDMKTLTV